MSAIEEVPSLADALKASLREHGKRFTCTPECKDTHAPDQTYDIHLRTDQPQLVHLLHHRFDRGQEFAIYAWRPDAEADADKIRSIAPEHLIEVVTMPVLRGPH